MDIQPNNDQRVHHSSNLFLETENPESSACTIISCILYELFTYEKKTPSIRILIF